MEKNGFKKNLIKVINAKLVGEKIIIVSHSMGVANAAGMQKEMANYGIYPDLQVAMAPYVANHFGEKIDFGKTRTYQFNNRGDWLTNKDFKIDGANVSKYLRDGGNHMQWEFDWMFNYLPPNVDNNSIKGYINGTQVPFSDQK